MGCKAEHVACLAGNRPASTAVPWSCCCCSCRATYMFIQGGTLVCISFRLRRAKCLSSLSSPFIASSQKDSSPSSSFLPFVPLAASCSRATCPVIPGCIIKMQSTFRAPHSHLLFFLSFASHGQVGRQMRAFLTKNPRSSSQRRMNERGHSTIYAFLPPCVHTPLPQPPSPSPHPLRQTLSVRADAAPFRKGAKSIDE